MPGNSLATRRRLTVQQFHAFLDGRPESEKWELIDGEPMMMAPPTLVHQRICKNIARAVDVAIDAAARPWQCDREVGLLLPDDDNYNPEPDVTVIDTDVEIGQIYATRFYFVAEVLSFSDKPDMLAAKLGYYQAHEHCRGVLVVRQDRVEAELSVRPGWSIVRLTDPSAAIVVPDFGDIGPLGEFYRNTPLSPG